MTLDKNFHNYDESLCYELMNHHELYPFLTNNNNIQRKYRKLSSEHYPYSVQNVHTSRTRLRIGFNFDNFAGVTLSRI